jgi:hypothetical protein
MNQNQFNLGGSLHGQRTFELAAFFCDVVSSSHLSALPGRHSTYIPVPQAQFFGEFEVAQRKMQIV